MAPVDLSLTSLSKPGRWLILSALSTKGSLLLAAAIIGHLAGAEALGYAEAARVVAQPVMVLGIGLADVLSPRMMEAGHRRDSPDGLAARRLFLGIFWGVGLIYLGYAAVDWTGNLMSRLVPTAYEVGGLVAVSILANLIVSAVYPYRLELLGGGKERPLAVTDTWSAAAPLLMAFLSGFTLSFARPFGLAAQGAYQTFGYQRAARHMYDSDPSSGQSGADANTFEGSER